MTTDDSEIVYFRHWLLRRSFITNERERFKEEEEEEKKFSGKKMIGNRNNMATALLIIYHADSDKSTRQCSSIFLLSLFHLLAFPSSSPPTSSFHIPTEFVYLYLVTGCLSVCYPSTLTVINASLEAPYYRKPEFDPFFILCLSWESLHETIFKKEKKNLVRTQLNKRKKPSVKRHGSWLF